MFAIEDSPLGRIVVAETPERFALIYTTRDLEGRLDGDVVAQITRLIRARFGFDTMLATCNQVHGATVSAARSEQAWRECDSCDALWATEKRVALGIKVADCLPVTIIDPRHDVIANTHSGWRGAVQKITAATIEAIAANSAFEPSSSHAYFGPSIRVCCFEVGEEVVDQFRGAFSGADRFIDRAGAKPHIDLAALTAGVLLDQGFLPGNIHDSGLCTRCDEGAARLSGFDAAKSAATPLFHSFRRDAGRGGRNLAIVAQ